MAWTIEDALSDPDLQVVSHRNDEWVVRIGVLKTLVTIRLARKRNGTVEWSQFHAMKTPTQVGPYWTSRPFDTGDNAYEYALHRAVSSLTEYYREGVEAGHTPEETWLVRG